MKRLFLDDVRHPYECVLYMSGRIGEQVKIYHEEWTIVKNYNGFVEYITKFGLPDIISFDHDLAEIHYDPSTWTEGYVYNEKTGYDCAKWLCDYCAENSLELPQYTVHSMNPSGTDNIMKYLKNFEKFKKLN